jgi:CRP-like cAMP-binding protein
MSFNLTKFKKGQILIKENTPNEDVFLVKSGEFRGTK